MKSAASLLCVVMLVLLASSGASEDGKRAGEEERRRKAIDRAVSWLSRNPPTAAFRVGISGLFVAALRRHGVAIDDPRMRDPMSVLRACAEKSQTILPTYEKSCALMGLEAYSAREEGLGGTPLTRLERALHRPLDTPIRASAERLTKELLSLRGPNGWSYGVMVKSPDISNTEFALVGLLCAEGLGIGLPVDVWRELSDVLGTVWTNREDKKPRRVSFEIEWADGARSRISAVPQILVYCDPVAQVRIELPVDQSSHVAGTLAYVRSTKRAGRVSDWKVKGLKRDKQIRSMLARIPGFTNLYDNGMPYYTIHAWTFGQLMEALGVKRIDGKDWYREFETRLLDDQHKDGWWRYGFWDGLKGRGGRKWNAPDSPSTVQLQRVVSTSFALLFLRPVARRKVAVTPSPQDKERKAQGSPEK